MRVEVRLYGGLTERARASRIHVEVPDDATVAELRAAVAEQQPALAPLLPGVKVAVDLEVAGDAEVVGPDRELALLPPVAGGAAGQLPPGGGRGPGSELPRAGSHGEVVTLTGLVAPPIDVTGAIDAVTSPDVGGTAIFLGTVRDHAPDLGGVVGLDYSTYPEMAHRVLADLAVEVADDHPKVRGIALLHAFGELDVGDHTVLIVCAAAHRAPAFDACRDALERVKDHTPVWKRERTADGDHRWVGLTDPRDQPKDLHVRSTDPNDGAEDRPPGGS